MKKEPLSIMIVKTFLAVIIFTGVGMVVIGGAHLIGKQGKVSKLVKLIQQYPDPIENEVIIVTDKTEYEQGETVKITVENNTDKKVRIYIPLLGIEHFDNNNWVRVNMLLSACGVFGGLVHNIVDPYNTAEYNWHQEEKLCNTSVVAGSEPISKQVPAGKYRIKSVVIDLYNADNKQTIYSNEFTIK